MNKTIYTFVIVFFSILQINAQNFTKKWNEVYELELQGKTKTAFEKVAEIHKIALRQKNDIQQVKSFIYSSKFKNTLVENSEINFFTEIQNEINKSSEIGKAFLHQYYATKLSEFYSKNYNIRYRPKMIDSTSLDITIWDKEKFEDEILLSFEKSHQNQALLSKLKVVDFSELITPVDSYFIDKDKTLFQFFIENYIKKLNENDVYDYEYPLNDNYFTNTETFIAQDLNFIENKKLRKTAELFQILEKNTTEKPSNFTLDRIKYFNLKCVNSKEKTKLIEKYKDQFYSTKFSNEVDLLIAENLVLTAEKINNEENNYKALLILNKLVSDKSNPNRFKKAFNLKESILSKMLQLDIKKEVYPNENLRALIHYKNIDTLVISYYKINFKETNSFNKDSLVLDYINKHEAQKSYFKILPNKKDYFHTSTEILLEPFESGNYLVVVGTPKNNGNYSFSYKIVLCNSITYFNEKKDGKESFHFRDRKTGIPIKDVIIRTDEKAYLADEYGRFTITQPQKNGNNYSYPLTIIHKNDTIKKIINYNNSYSQNYKEASFKGQAYIYTDRGIYRPGQKLFYKGIITKEIDYETNIVPFVTVKIEINNPDYETIKTFEVQTNEFGSFSGDFEIPNNGETGDYKIKVYAPDNIKNDKKYYNEEEKKHSFWDDVDFNEGNQEFIVEEYKRSTFEVKIEPIAREWKLNDEIIVKGKATGLANNTISDAEVKAEITCSISENNKNRRFSYEDFITKTNPDGTFEIKFSTKDIKVTDSIYKCDFNVKIVVIDTNGETRSANQKIIISNNIFDLKIISKKGFLQEEKNKTLKISAKTFNDTDITTNGKLYIYKNVLLNNILQRQTGEPEIKSIDSLTYKKLFPHEHYYSDELSKETLVKIIDFNTKTNGVINIDFLEVGFYKCIATAYDSNNNKITTALSININTKKQVKPNNCLFNYYIITSENSKKIEVVLKSKIDNLFVTCFEYDEKGNVVLEHMIQLKNGEGKTYINKPKNRLGLYFFAFFEDRFYADTHTSFYNESKNRLKVDIVSMRNKIEPGSTENWQFKILDSNLEAEILASMYDASLDEFIRHYWRAFEKPENRIFFPDYYNNYNRDQIYISNIDKKTIDFNFNTSNQLKWFYFKETPTNLKKINKFEPKKKIIGIVETLDNIPAKALITNLSHHGYANTDFYGNFTILGEVNDILEIYIHDQTFKVKVTDLKDFKVNLNVNQNSEVASQTQFVKVISRNLPLKSKNILINNKDIFYESNITYLDTLSSLDKNLGFYDSSNEIEVVQIAYGIVRKKDNLAYNYSTINKYADADPNYVLTGKVSGLQINTLNADTNSTPKIVINGNRSITGNNNALIVIDGIVSNASVLQQIPPNFIDSMEVIKGSQGVALYGEQGANGVIIVTTKKAMQELSNVKTRKNFNETAFFYPHIRTDKDGKFVIEFTTPESLTKWNLNIIAHNKSGEIGGFGSEIIAQKDVMIIPNMPRFVRENDELVVTAKISNLLNEVKTGIAKLSLFDAETGNPINVLVETKEIQDFNCKAKGSTTVQWKIKIPKDIQGLQYKIVAKAGNFTDGEENILPVLKNAVLITESQPVWLKSKNTKTITFEAISNNSETKENHKISINLVTNPIWSAIESLPYLMEYEHDCAEQTFSKLFANSISEKIINQNPKIKLLLENWKQNSTSKLKMNEELKSVLLSETPWLVENNDELQKRISALLDVAKLKTTNDILFQKLKEKQSDTGGFSWFGTNNENEYITRHILSGIGHLTKLNPESELKYKDIVSKGIAYLDSKFEATKTKRVVTSDLHYLYARSFFLKEHPLSIKQDSIIKLQLIDYKKNWLENSLYEKTVLALILHRFDDKSFAKKIIENLRESTILDDTKGMFWKENTNGYYWYQSNIELQALLIEAFAEIDYKTNEIEAMKVWLINNKQNKNWNTTKSTALAINAIISYGKDWLNSESKIQINDGKNPIIQQQMNSKLKEKENGLINLEIKPEQITKNFTAIKLENNGIAPVYGGVYYQYFENLDKISATTSIDYSISKELLKDDKLVNTENLKVGDLITIRLTFKTEKDLEFVHLKDLRASCFEPINVISETKRINNTHYYMSTKDVASHFFFDNLPKGTYVLEYKVRVNNEGVFSDGFANLQSMYAPEFSAHSKSGTIKTIK